MPTQKNRRLPLILAFALLMGLAMPLPGLSADEEKTQVTVSGSADVQYYNANGTAATAQSYDVSVNKTIAQAKNGTVPMENEFKVDLTVQTTTNYEQILTTRAAGVVLALDMSSSMEGDCAVCGRTATNANPREDYGRVPAHHLPDAAPQRYCRETMTDYEFSKGAFFHDTNGDGKCNGVQLGNQGSACGKTLAEHIPQHLFLSRLDTAKTEVQKFLKQYVNAADGAARYLSVVVFSDKDKTTHVLNWTDINAYSDADITNLVTNIYSGGNIGNDTNTTGGMNLALWQIQHLPITVPAGQSSVILMTDGLPGEASKYTSSGYNAGPFLSEFQAATAFNEKCGIDYKAETKKSDVADALPYFNSIASFGFHIRGTGAAMYTISFDSGDAKSPMRRYLPDIMDKFATEGYSTSDDTSGLGGAFTEIIKKMTELKPNTVSDFLPAAFHYVPDSFEGKGKASAQQENGTISWILSQVPPDKTEQIGGKTINTYTLSYRMTLDNLDKDFVNNVDTPVNLTSPTFVYQMYVDNVAGPTHKVTFNIPKVKAAAVDLTFKKVMPNGSSIKKTGEEAATFEVYADVGPDGIVGATPYRTDIHNNDRGTVTVSALPSGHTYTLVETKAPAGHALNADPAKNQYPIHVRWGQMTTEDGTLIDSQNPLKVVNRYDPKPATFTIEKIWDDQSSAYKGKTITYRIYVEGNPDTTVASGTMTYDAHNVVSGSEHTAPIGTQAAANDKTWKTTVVLPTINDQSNTPITYVIEEKNISGYTNTNAEFHSESHKFVLENKVVGTRNFTVDKVWVDDETNTQHPSVTFHLYLVTNDTAAPTYFGKKTLPAGSGDDTVTFKDVPITYTGNQKYGYQVKEEIGTDGDSYYLSKSIPVTDQNGDITGYEITNSSTALGTTDFTYHKHWYDSSNAAGARPASIQIHLEQDLSDRNGWTPVADSEKTWSAPATDTADIWYDSYVGLPRYVQDAQGQDTATVIKYKVVEDTTTEGYKVDYLDGGDFWDINNTYQYTNYTVNKRWVQPSDLDTPDVTFVMKRAPHGTAFDNDAAFTQFGEPKVLVSGQDSLTFANLPIFDDVGDAWVYRVFEEIPADSAYTYTVTREDAGKPNFTNTIQDPNDVTVSGNIRWELRGESEEVLPTQVTVQLVGAQDKTVTTTATTVGGAEGKGWYFEFKDLPRYTADKTTVIQYSVVELWTDETGATVIGPDASTVLFTGTDGTARHFGVHYDPVVAAPDNKTFTANLRNHTDAEEQGYIMRVDRVYDYSLNGVAAPTVTLIGSEINGERTVSPTTITKSFQTGDYAEYERKTYPFVSGEVKVGASSVQSIAAGNNTVTTADKDVEYVITLRYALSETTSTDDGDTDEPEKPPVTPTVPPVTPTVPPVTPTVPPVTPTEPPVIPTEPPVTPPPGFEDAPEILPGDIVGPPDADSPDHIIIVDEDGVPLGYYTKTLTEDGEYVYLDENGVPLGGQPKDDAPKTGDQNRLGLMAALMLLSFTGMVYLSSPRCCGENQGKKRR